MATESTQQTLDVRQIDGEPFGEIMAALGDLPEDESLRLISSFEPEPLYTVLTGRGFTHETEKVDTDEFHVEIRHAE